MRMTEIDFSGPPPVDSYANGGFRVAGTWYDGDLVLTAEGVQRLSPSWPDAEALTPVLKLREQLDVVLIGQGAEIAPLDPGLRAALEGAGLGFEQMSTPSACRTYNVLLTENRRVGAILLAL